MSLSDLARRLRNKSRAKVNSVTDHGDSSTSSSWSTSSRGDSDPPLMPYETTARRSPPIQIPIPQTIDGPALLIPTPQSSGIAMHASDSPSTPRPRPHPMDGALAQLTAMSAQLNAGPAIQGIDRSLDRLGNKAENYAPHKNMAMSIINHASQASQTLEQLEITKNIERGIQRFADDIPWLMKGLDELARIHPVVTVAVLAFKAVYALETTRQENDRRVMTLYVEMKDMMMVMVQLKGIDNRTHLGLDGRVLKDRLEELAEQTAKDIENCANFCDTFLKKKLLVKVIKGPIWADKLAGFVQVFADRTAAFQFALAMHTANSLTDVKRQNSDIQAKLDVLVGLFSRLVSPEEQKIAAEVEKKGGANKIRQMDEVTLKSLIALEISVRGELDDTKGPDANQSQEMSSDTVRRGKATMTMKKSLSLDELKVELREDVDYALTKNYETFIGKFELQVSMLQIALERYIHTENDRVIGAVTHVMTQGPHMKIKDPELRKIWQDMGWRGNVKARLFVITLQDHYRDSFEHTVVGRGDPVASDEWALQFLSMTWLEPIMEAFDDDASGYVTIAEVNRLMDMRPPDLNWSIPHWLAYWAIGWKIGASMYANRIMALLSVMKDVVPAVLPRNRVNVDDYFAVYWWIAMLVTGLQNSSDVEFNTPINRFQEYIDIEEKRLRGNLEKVKYNIDASDTLILVMGVGGLEKNALTLICLLLENDLRKLIAAQSVVLARTEFMRSQGNIGQIISAVQRRVNELNGLYLQRKLDTKEQFWKHAYGLFFNYSLESDFWALNNSHASFFTHAASLVQDGPSDVSGLELETQPPVDTTLYDNSDEVAEEDLNAPESLRPVLGQWYGFSYNEKLYPTRTMLSPHFHYTVKTNAATVEDFHGSGIEYDGEEFNISGTVIHAPDGTVYVSWTLTFVGDINVLYTGRLIDERTIMGMRSYGPSSTYPDWSFVLKKLPAEDLPFYPSPQELQSNNKYHALWKYAINATLNNVRRRWWTWSYFAQRRDARKAYVELTWDMIDHHSPDHDSRLSAIGRICTPKDVRFYDSIMVKLLDTVPLHNDPGPCCNYMDNSHPMRGARYICIDCIQEPFFLQVTFCDKEECYRQTLPKFSLPGLTKTHYPTHSLIKVRTIVHRLRWPILRDQALEVRDVLCTPSSMPGPISPPPIPSSLTDLPKASPFGGNGDRLGQDEGPGVISQTGGDLQSPLLNVPQVNVLKSLEDTAHAVLSPPPVQDSARDQQLHEPRSPQDEGLRESTESSLGAGEHENGSGDNSRPPALLESGSAQLQNEKQVLPPVVNPRVSSRENSPAPPESHTLVCSVCSRLITGVPWWWCLQCSGCICDDCESKLLIGCWSCKKRFPQPTWYYGFLPKTDFICDTCCARGVKGPDPNYNRSTVRHDYTHPLLLISPRCLDPPDTPVPTSEDHRTLSLLAGLEERIVVMDGQLGRLQEQLERMELQLQVNNTKEETNAALLAKLTETLERVLEVKGNGHGLKLP